MAAAAKKTNSEEGYEAFFSSGVLRRHLSTNPTLRERRTLKFKCVIPLPRHLRGSFFPGVFTRIIRALIDRTKGKCYIVPAPCELHPPRGMAGRQKLRRDVYAAPDRDVNAALL